MVGTKSATQRGSHVLSRDMALATPEGQWHVSQWLVGIGKGDQLRGLAIAVAVVLTTLGLLTPRLDPLSLASLLFMAGAALALFAFGGWLAPEEAHFEVVKPVSEPIERLMTLPRSSVRPRTLTELLSRSTSRPSVDLAAWSHLTARMSHELRTPLNAVIGFSELMTAEVFGPLGADQYGDYARNIHKSGRSLLKSAEDALAITSLLTAANTAAREAVAGIAGGVADALDFYAAELTGVGLSVTSALDPGLQVVGEAQTLRQILINLVTEAMARATPASALVIAAHEHGEEITLTISLSHARSGASGSDSFALLLARTLVQLCGARIDETCADTCSWSIAAHFARASQRDFFHLH